MAKLAVHRISFGHNGGKCKVSFCAKIAHQLTFMVMNDAVVTTLDFVTITAFRDC